MNWVGLNGHILSYLILSPFRMTSCPTLFLFPWQLDSIFASVWNLQEGDPDGYAGWAHLIFV